MKGVGHRYFHSGLKREEKQSVCLILVKREPIEGRGEPNLEMEKRLPKEKPSITLRSEWMKDLEVGR